MRFPRRPRRVALLLPDGAAKVSLVRFATVPARAADLEGMLRWQVRKTVPFSVDEAQLDWSRGRLTASGEQEFVVVLARRTVVQEYERVCTAAGIHAGLVDLLGFSLLDTALARGAGDDGVDWLLVHIGPGSSTLVVVRGRHPLLFRTVHLGGASRWATSCTRPRCTTKTAWGGSGLSYAIVGGGNATPDGGRCHPARHRRSARHRGRTDRRTHGAPGAGGKRGGVGRSGRAGRAHRGPAGIAVDVDVTCRESIWPRVRSTTTVPVHLVLAGVGFAVVAVLVLGAMRLVELSRTHRALTLQAEAAETRSRRRFDSDGTDTSARYPEMRSHHWTSRPKRSIDSSNNGCSPGPPSSTSSSRPFRPP